MTLWDKGYSIDQKIQQFTIGQDPILDLQLAKYDVIASKAHARMLSKISMLSDHERDQLIKELNNITDLINEGDFRIDDGVEDVHSQIENILVGRLGETGKKIHLGRSRNDQVLVALRLFFKDQLDRITATTKKAVRILLDDADKKKDLLIPGYTHMQVAMVSSGGMWLSSFAEALLDDLDYMKGIKKTIYRNPLGTAAGYGSSIPIDRAFTTEALHMEGLCVNPINAQLGRGKTELLVAHAISSMALTINKLAMDVCLFSNENYGVFSLPKIYTTGSSIMPHKKNPDVFELMRARSNQLISLPSQISSIISNLTTGYHRDYQLLKELIFPALSQMMTLLDLVIHCIPQLEWQESQVYEDKYQYLWSVEVVNQYVKDGMSFREAYRKVGADIEEGKYVPTKEIQHTHIGSLGNLGLDLLRKRLSQID